jgi:hypothetical protein
MKSGKYRDHAPEGGDRRINKKGRAEPDLPSPLSLAAGTSVVSKASDRSSSGAQVVGRALARTLVLNDVVSDLLTFDEVAQTSALNCGDVDKHVGRAFIRLDETETLGAVEPLYGTCAHNDFLSIVGLAGETFDRLYIDVEGNLACAGGA